MASSEVKTEQNWLLSILAFCPAAKGGNLVLADILFFLGILVMISRRKKWLKNLGKLQFFNKPVSWKFSF